MQVILICGQGQEPGFTCLAAILPLQSVNCVQMPSPTSLPQYLYQEFITPSCLQRFTFAPSPRSVLAHRAYYSSLHGVHEGRETWLQPPRSSDLSLLGLVASSVQGGFMRQVFNV